MTEPNPGGKGAGAHDRRDLDAEQRALRQDWPIPPAVKRSLLQRAIDICDPETEVGARASPRLVLRALQVLSLFGNLTVKQAVVDLKREQLDAGQADGKGTLADLTADAERIAAERTPARRPEGGAA